MPARLRSLLPLLPALLAGIVFLQVTGFGFVNLDDDLYVTDNPLLAGGVDVGAAFASDHAEVWIPLTWLSFMADRAWQGPGPAGFHRTNLLLHLLNVVLAGLLLGRLLEDRAVALLAASVFAVHPLNVEAVAWVTARKDLLAGAFCLGALLVHAGRGEGRSAGRDAAVVVLGAAAMLAKPAAVVLPVWLALVDGARAARAGLPLRAAWARAAGAKLALVGAAAAVAVVAVRLADGANYGQGAPAGPFVRAGQAAWMVLVWLARAVVPRGLAPVYPPSAWERPTVVLLASAVAVAAVTVALLVRARRRPWPAAGWLWFLVGVAPAAGLVRGGQLMMADRYVYLPLLGLLLAAASALRELARARPGWRRPLAAAALAATALLAWGARRQAGHWHDPLALWSHTVAVTRDNALAHNSYGVALDAAGRPREALAHLERSLSLAPHSLAHYNAGNVLSRLGRPDDAAAQYRAALARDPDRVEAALNLSAVLAEAGRLDEALAVCRDLRARRPDLAAAAYNLGLVQWLRGERAEAEAAWRETLRLDPDHAGARDALARSRRTSTSSPASPDSSGP